MGTLYGIIVLLEIVRYLKVHVQDESAKVVTGAIAGTSSRSLLDELAWEELSIRFINCIISIR
jgi:hypothetical protein